MYNKLIEEALKAKKHAYAPYSNFRVGAALIDVDNKIYTGCNIENISFGATCCAERVAIFKAVSQGQKAFKAIVVVSDSKDFTFPCGICRQVMVEFKIPKIIVANFNGQFKEYNLEGLMPYAFDNLNID